MKHFEHVKVGQREIILYLPPSYAQQPDRRYPVAYVQDGGYLFTECSNYLEHLFAIGELDELILVGITTLNRNDEYTPWPAESLLPHRSPFGGKGKAYVDEVADVLKPYIDDHYRTQKEAEYTAIIGGSFGGLISLFAGYWRPETFGLIGLLSTSFWYEGVMDYIQDHEGLSNRLKVFMSVGLCEGIYKQNVQKHMVSNTKAAASLFVEKGLPEHSLRFVADPQGTHDDLFMIQRFPEALQWLFKKRGDVQDPQDPAAESIREFSIPGTEVWDMKSDRTGRSYRIHIAKPADPPPEEGYPVLYSLDANASFGTLAESMRLQSRRPHGISPALIVGIGYDSNDPIVSNERFYDYTVYADEAELPARPNREPWPKTGGADEFLTFIEEELKPRVEERYAIDRSKQSLFGHSLGGFLSLYSLFTRPGTFQRYIAASPSVWWKNHVLYKVWNDREEAKAQQEKRLELLIVVGAEEKPSMVRDAKDLYALLQASSTGIHSMLQVIEDEGHVSVIPSLISPMFRFITR